MSKADLWMLTKEATEKAYESVREYLNGFRELNPDGTLKRVGLEQVDGKEANQDEKDAFQAGFIAALNALEKVLAQHEERLIAIIEDARKGEK